MKNNYRRPHKQRYFTDNDSFDRVVQWVDSDLAAMSSDVLGPDLFQKLYEHITTQAVQDMENVKAVVLNKVDFRIAMNNLKAIISTYFASKAQEVFNEEKNMDDPRISVLVDIPARWMVEAVDLGYQPDGMRKLTFLHTYWSPESLEEVYQMESMQLHNQLAWALSPPHRNMLQ